MSLDAGEANLGSAAVEERPAISEGAEHLQEKKESEIVKEEELTSPEARRVFKTTPSSLPKWAKSGRLDRAGTGETGGDRKEEDDKQDVEEETKVARAKDLPSRPSRWQQRRAQGYTLFSKFDKEGAKVEVDPERLESLPSTTVPTTTANEPPGSSPACKRHAHTLAAVALCLQFLCFVLFSTDPLHPKTGTIRIAVGRLEGFRKMRFADLEREYRLCECVCAYVCVTLCGWVHFSAKVECCTFTCLVRLPVSTPHTS